MTPNGALASFFAAAANHDRDRASAILEAEPRLATDSIHVAAMLGHEGVVRRLIEEDPGRVRLRLGDPSAEPLLWLCHSPFHGESPERDAALEATARSLLAAGADPQTVDGRYGVPALHGVTGEYDAPGVARILLEAGADPTDGESVFHAAERFHEGALALLWEFGVQLNHAGEWGNTPLYFLLRHWDVAREPRVRQGLDWLLDHGADPDVRCGREQEGSLHVAVRVGQAPEIVRVLLDRGADVNATRGDGRTPWVLALRSGSAKLARMLEEAGAAAATLSPADTLLAACGTGDVEGALRLTSHGLVSSLAQEDLALLPRAAEEGRVDVVQALLAAGVPVDAVGEYGATALHLAAVRGRAAIVRALLHHAPDLTIRDPEHRSTPLGWACFGADFFADSGGDHVGCVQALLEAGARLAPDEHQPDHTGVRDALRDFARRGDEG
jgi:ankyrin repeat protein